MTRRPDGSTVISVCGGDSWLAGFSVGNLSTCMHQQWQYKHKRAASTNRTHTQAALPATRTGAWHPWKILGEGWLARRRRQWSCRRCPHWRTREGHLGARVAAARAAPAAPRAAQIYPHAVRSSQNMPVWTSDAHRKRYPKVPVLRYICG